MKDIINEMKANLERAEDMLVNRKWGVNDRVLGRDGVYIVEVKSADDVRVATNPADAIRLDRVNARRQAVRFQNGNGTFRSVHITEALEEYVTSQRSVIEQLSSI